jgi:hypothetical protein
MHKKHIAKWHHDHIFGQDQKRSGEKRTLIMRIAEQGCEPDCLKQRFGYPPLRSGWRVTAALVFSRNREA